MTATPLLEWTAKQGLRNTQRFLGGFVCVVWRSCSKLADAQFPLERTRNKPEIDIVEYNGGHPNIANQTYHYFDSNRTRWASGESHSSPTMETNTGNLSDNYHTYSVLWEEELMVWYIDDVEVRRVRDRDPEVRLRVLAQQEELEPGELAVAALERRRHHVQQPAEPRRRT